MTPVNWAWLDFQWAPARVFHALSPLFYGTRLSRELTTLGISMGVYHMISKSYLYDISMGRLSGKLIPPTKLDICHRETGISCPTLFSEGAGFPIGMIDWQPLHSLARWLKGARKFVDWQSIWIARNWQSVIWSCKFQPMTVSKMLFHPMRKRSNRFAQTLSES